MALATFDDLITALDDELKGTLDGEDLARHITFAEGDFFRLLKHYEMETVATLDTVGNAIALPADHQETNLITVDGKSARLTSRSASMLRPGEIGYYYSGRTLVFVPAQTAPRTVELVYFAKPAALSEDNQTNWVIQQYPAVYFHASAARGYRYRGNAEAEASEKAALQEALGQVALDHRRVTQMGNSIIDSGGVDYGD